ncbi:biotin/lipoyl-containing protein [Roseospirillum parvum]|uniref:Biotin-requiring enzyme n=1 Tax=Roseospirillum parvum TaxID=83401 RepID=A0A1G7WVQ0_9PROT|nr:biotin/lipoyl-containing protein [Roseospirillum parvum]SDG76021.1 Biotin-requiring enzyme [Roseospirillum parvum]
MRSYRITVEGVAYEVTVEELGGPQSAPGVAPAPAAIAAPQAAPAPLPAAPAAATPAPPPAAGAGDVPSPLAGTVVEVHVAAGQAVAAGAPLVTLEAMKMNTPIQAPQAGTVGAVHVAAGQAVQEGQALVSLT